MSTTANLARRHVQVDPNYELCNENLVTVLHSIWSCERAKEVWNNFPQLLQYVREVPINFLLLTTQCLNFNSGQDFELCLMVAWSICCSRNVFKFEHAPRVQFSNAKSLLQDFKRVQEQSEVTRSSWIAQWNTQQQGIYKINFVGALFKDTRWSGALLKQALCCCGVSLRDLQRKLNLLQHYRSFGLHMKQASRILILKGDSKNLMEP